MSTNNTRSMSSVLPTWMLAVMLRMPGEEDYWQISWKVLLALEWALGAADFDYVLKTDDDSYVCVPAAALAHGAWLAELLYGGSPLMQRCAARQDLRSSDSWRPTCTGALGLPPPRRVPAGHARLWYVLSARSPPWLRQRSRAAADVAAALDARDGDGGRGGAGEDVTIGALLRWWNASRVFRELPLAEVAEDGEAQPRRRARRLRRPSPTVVHGLGTAELMRACAEGTARRNSGDGCRWRSRSEVGREVTVVQ